MRRALPLALAFAGLAALAYGWTRGEVDVGFFLIVPFVLGRGPFAALGVLLLVAAGIAWFVGRVRDAGPVFLDDGSSSHAGREAPDRSDASPSGTTSRMRHGGVVLLGPFPIAWGSDRGMVKGVLVLALVLAAVMLALLLLPPLFR